MSKSKYLLIAALSSIIIAWVFIFWWPSPDHDLYRYFEWMNFLRSASIGEIIKFTLSRGELFSVWYFWLISQTGLYGLLQFFPTVASLMIVQYIALDYCERKSISYLYGWFAIMFFFCVFEIFLVPSGIRSTLALSLFSLILYTESICGKEKIRKYYLFLPLIHLGSIIPITVRFLVRSYRPAVVGVLAVLGVIFLMLPGQEILLWVVGDSYLRGDIISVNIYKIANYLDYYLPISGPYLYKVSKVFLMIALLFLLIKDKRDSKLFNKTYFALLLLSVLSIGKYVFWYRVLEIVIIASPIIVLQVIDKLRRRSIASRLLMVGLLIFAMIGIRVQLPYFFQDEFYIRDEMPTYKNQWKVN